MLLRLNLEWFMLEIRPCRPINSPSDMYKARLHIVGFGLCGNIVKKLECLGWRTETADYMYYTGILRILW